MRLATWPAALSLLGVSFGAASAAVPANFVDELVAGGLTNPLSLAFIPGQRALVVEQTTGRIRLVQSGAVTTLVTVPDINTSGHERGLLGIAVDPAWPTRPYVYVHYNHAPSSKICISRLTATGDLSGNGSGSLAISAASLYRVLVDIPDSDPNHNGGTLRFGPDGMLYASLGEDYAACDAQDRTLLKGVILRLDVRFLPDGAGGPPAVSSLVAPGNPYAGASSPNERLVWAYGLRNPFRFTVDPVSGNLYVGDVGQDRQEELDEIQGGGVNLGWPWREATQTYSSCSNSGTGLSGPIHAYTHGGGSQSIVAGPRYRRTSGSRQFPIEYEGDVFYSDFFTGNLVRLELSGSTWQVAPPVAGQSGSAWGTGFENVADYQIAPDGSIWYCDRGSNQVRRIAYVGNVDVPAADVVTPAPAGDFDVQGRRVGDPNASGIYFLKGKKRVVVK